MLLAEKRYQVIGLIYSSIVLFILSIADFLSSLLILKKLHKYFNITVAGLPIGSAQKKGEGMTELIVWIKTNWESVLAIIGGIVSVATIIVKLTPTQKRRQCTCNDN